MELAKTAAKERRKLTKILTDCEVPEARLKALAPIVENAAWIKAQLDAAREMIATAPIVIEYDNGGGQTGTRINPAFQGYEQLWKAYIAGMSKILDILPAAAADRAVDRAAEPSNVLALIQRRRKA